MSVNLSIAPEFSFGFSDVVENGVFYNPAWKHYGERTSVFCDKCRKEVSMCIGYGKKDLCLKCASEFSDKLDSDLGGIRYEVQVIRRMLDGHSLNWNREREIMKEIEEGTRMVILILKPPEPSIYAPTDCWGHGSRKRQEEADQFRRELVDRIVKKYQTTTIFMPS